MYSYYEKFFNKLALLLKTVVMGGPLTYNFSNPGNLLGKVRLPENPVKIKYHPHCAFIVLKVSSQRLCMKTHSPTFTCSQFYSLASIQMSVFVWYILWIDILLVR